MELFENKNSQIDNEIRILKKLKGCFGVPSLVCHGFYFDMRKVLVTSVFGDSLQRLYEFGSLRKEEIVPIGYELKFILQSIHKRGIVHRDLNPTNIIRTKIGKIYLIDFGLSYCEGDSDFLNYQTLCFASIAGLSGGKPSPIDDWESLLYTLTFLYTGNLPWIKEKSVLQHLIYRAHFQILPIFSPIFQDVLPNLFRNKS